MSAEKLLEQLTLADEDALTALKLLNTPDAALLRIEALNNLGIAAKRAGQEEGALRNHEKAWESGKDLIDSKLLDAAQTARAYLLCCIAASKSGRTADAIGEISQALLLMPNEAEYYDQRAELYEQLNDKERAQADYAKSKLLRRRDSPTP